MALSPIVYGDSSVTDNPYASIAARNIFAMKAPRSIEIPPAAPSCKITPNGTMSILGRKQVLFKVASLGASGQLSRETSYILGENEQTDGVGVVEIDELAGWITFNNHGVNQKIALAGAPPADPEQTGNPKMAGVVGHGRIPPYFVDDANANGEFHLPTKEKQIQMIENLRAYYKSQNDPRAQSLPPTAMTPPDTYLP